MSERGSRRSSNLLFLGNRRVSLVKPGIFAIFLPKYLNHVWSMIRKEGLEVYVYVEIPEDVKSRIKNSLITREEERVSSWDKGLDFRKTRYYLISSIKSSTKPGRCYDMILLTRLLNGARVSEAVRAFKEYVKTGNAGVKVPLSKSKMFKTRTIIIPTEMIEEYVHECIDLAEVSDKKLIARVKNHAIRKHGFNTHSLRQAFIVHQLKQGVDPEKLAKAIIGYKHHNRIFKLMSNTSSKTGKQSK